MRDSRIGWKAERRAAVRAETKANKRARRAGDDRVTVAVAAHRIGNERKVK